MAVRRASRLAILVGTIAAAWALAACGRVPADASPIGEPTGVIPPTPTASLPAPDATLPAATATLPSGQATEPGAGMPAPDVPYDISGPEIIAHNVGQATYSGYACVISPAGCACELPELRESLFVFSSDGPLYFTFAIDDFSQTWEMLRVGINQWEYAVVLQSSDRNSAIGQARAILTFTTDGYVITQVIDYYETGVVTCPEVAYRRLISP